jgi:hypothetical protein
MAVSWVGVTRSVAWRKRHVTMSNGSANWVNAQVKKHTLLLAVARRLAAFGECRNRRGQRADGQPGYRAQGGTTTSACGSRNRVLTLAHVCGNP